MRSNRRLEVLAVALLLAAPLGACNDPGGPPVGGANGTVRAIAFLDSNGNGRQEQGEGGLGGLKVSIVLASGAGTPITGTTRGDGTALLLDVQPARYKLLVDSASVGDTLRVLSIDSSSFTVRAADTTTVVAAISFPRMSIAEARAAAGGRKLFVEGTAITGQSAFGDGTMYLADPTGTIRAIRLAGGTAQPGDSVRVLAIRSDQSGQPVLADFFVLRLKPGALPPPTKLTTAQVASAKGGTLDAAFARAERATLLDSRPTPTGSTILTIDDGSGPAEINLGRSQSSPLLVGANVNVSGVLVPEDNTPGSWQIRPFLENQIEIFFDSLSIAQARTQPIGKTFKVIGVALNGWATFGDGSVHVQDATAAIRGVRVGQANVFAGDSIELTGTLAIVNGQPVLSGGQVRIRKQNVGAPAPSSVSTLTASTADGGRLDAAAVRIAGVVKDTLSATTGQFLMRVDDGTGPLEVLIEPSTGLRRPTLVPGATVEVGGVLVPFTNSAFWQLKPRAPDDLIVR